MIDQRPEGGGQELRIEIDPQPSEEELVVIMQALRALQGSASPATDAAPRSNWQRIARGEALRSADWPSQRLEWSAGRR